MVVCKCHCCQEGKRVKFVRQFHLFFQVFKEGLSAEKGRSKPGELPNLK